jgi:hypothetical protein
MSTERMIYLLTKYISDFLFILSRQTVRVYFPSQNQRKSVRNFISFAPTKQPVVIPQNLTI